ncbi:MAG: RES family NAD+ phosphorylase [Actinobacteria bacterium]|nr:RES family NAD+ phosphorylase [Actinomycetota bacterium]
MVRGTFHRHCSPRQRPLSGNASGGRWGPEGAYPVLYLGRPIESVVVEAYRHLVEPTEGMKPEMVGPRKVVTCELAISNVLDLRDEGNRATVGLSLADVTGAVGDYEACQQVGLAAHQLEMHGIIAPAATGLGETLAIFERHLPADEQPAVLGEETWDGLPADPRTEAEAKPRGSEQERSKGATE